MNGCCMITSCGCGRVETSTSFFKVKGLKGNVNPYIVGTQANINNLSINLSVEYDFYSKLHSNYNGAFLMACSPGQNPTLSKEKLTNLTIKSNAKFSSNFDANVNLSNTVQIYTIDSVEGSNSSMGSFFSNIPSYLQTNPTSPFQLKLRFNEAPTTDKIHIFTISYEESNGNIYTFTTPEITFP
ncbi:MAG: hypothetical protein EAZ85_11075 [Bacteroidetes bacterium]|nr:MAG: hypothetical protein EAZ85_11075 [Bacteroidota bacterium]